MSPADIRYRHQVIDRSRVRRPRGGDHAKRFPSRHKILSDGLLQHLGIELQSLEPDRAQLRLPYDARLATVGDVVHGGAIASLIDTAVYLSFFPHLVAGPIVRAKEFLPQLAEPRDPSRVAVGSGRSLEEFEAIHRSNRNNNSRNRRPRR